MNRIQRWLKRLEVMEASPGMCEGCPEVIYNEDRRFGDGCKIESEFLNVGFPCPKGVLVRKERI